MKRRNRVLVVAAGLYLTAKSVELFRNRERYYAACDSNMVGWLKSTEDAEALAITNKYREAIGPEHDLLVDGNDFRATFHEQDRRALVAIRDRVLPALQSTSAEADYLVHGIQRVLPPHLIGHTLYFSPPRFTGALSWSEVPSELIYRVENGIEDLVARVRDND